MSHCKKKIVLLKQSFFFFFYFYGKHSFLLILGNVFLTCFVWFTEMLAYAWAVDQVRERRIVYVSEECDNVWGTGPSHVILPCVCLLVFVSVCVQYTVEEGLTDCLPIEVWPLLSVEHYKPQRCTLQSGRILTRPSPAVPAVSLCPRWGCGTEDFTAMSM